jgi:two-component system invasion response regulator UvrY
VTRPDPPEISVLIADDSAPFRAAFKDLLASVGLKIVGEAALGEAALKMAGPLVPDVVFMHIRMPGIGGVEAARRMLAASPRMRLILISASRGEVPEDAWTCGASTVLEKQELLDTSHLLATSAV